MEQSMGHIQALEFGSVFIGLMDDAFGEAAAARKPREPSFRARLATRSECADISSQAGHR
jgi:hypothetical protein